MKICNRCNLLKNDFNKDASKHDGLYTICKECKKKSDNSPLAIGRRRRYQQNNKEKAKLYCANNKERINKNKIKYREKHKENIAKYQKEYRQNNKSKQRKYNLKKYHNMTVEQYEKMLDNQSGLCDICKEVKQLVVDHNHKTGKVRSLLCRNCNTGLGSFYENISILTNAIKYIERYDKNGYY